MRVASKGQLRDSFKQRQRSHNPHSYVTQGLSLKASIIVFYDSGAILINNAAPINVYRIATGVWCGQGWNACISG